MRMKIYTIWKGVMQYLTERKKEKSIGRKEKWWSLVSVIVSERQLNVTHCKKIKYIENFAYGALGK